MSICGGSYAHSSHGFTGSPKAMGCTRPICLSHTQIHKAPIQKWTHSLYTCFLSWNTLRRSDLQTLSVSLYLSVIHFLSLTHTHSLPLFFHLLWLLIILVRTALYFKLGPYLSSPELLWHKHALCIVSSDTCCDIRYHVGRKGQIRKHEQIEKISSPHTRQKDASPLSHKEVSFSRTDTDTSSISEQDKDCGCSDEDLMQRCF